MLQCPDEITTYTDGNDMNGGGMMWRIALRGTASRSGEMRAALLEAGAASGDIAESREGGCLLLSLYLSSHRDAESFRTRLAGGLPQGVSIVFEELRPADWQTKWKEGFAPFLLTERYRVVPSWMRDTTPPLAGAEDLSIDTDTAFGTGEHATTAMVAGLLQSHAGKVRRLLDAGTGTGILGILGMKCGIPRVDGFDIDPAAVRTAELNAAANGCRFDRLDVCPVEDFLTAAPYDFVAANLLARVLIPAREHLVSLVRPGGLLAVSGVWGSDYPRFRSAFTGGAPLRCVRVLRREGWVAALYRRD